MTPRPSDDADGHIPLGKRVSEMALTFKQQRFVEEYLIDFNATAAAKRAGYSPRIAMQVGHANMRKHEIASAIAGERKRLAARCDLAIDRIVSELALIAFSTILDCLPLLQEGSFRDKLARWTRDQAAAVSSLSIQEVIVRLDADGQRSKIRHRLCIKVRDKLRAPYLLRKHLGMFPK